MSDHARLLLRRLLLGLALSIPLGVLDFTAFWAPGFLPGLIMLWVLPLFAWTVGALVSTAVYVIVDRSITGIAPSLPLALGLWPSVFVPSLVGGMQSEDAARIVRDLLPRLEAYRKAHDTCPSSLDDVAAFDGRPIEQARLGARFARPIHYMPPREDPDGLGPCDGFSYDGPGLIVCTWWSPSDTWFCDD